MLRGHRSRDECLDRRRPCCFVIERVMVDGRWEWSRQRAPTSWRRWKPSRDDVPSVLFEVGKSFRHPCQGDRFRIAYAMFSVNRACWDVQVHDGVTHGSVNVRRRMTIVPDLFRAAYLSRTHAKGVLGHVVEAQTTKVDSRCPPWSANALWCRASVGERHACIRGEMSTK